MRSCHTYRTLGPALLVLALAFVGGCKSKYPGEYVNKKHGYRIVFPAKWEIKENTSGLDVGAFSPLTGLGDKFHENITVASSPMKAPLTSDQVLDEMLPSMLSVITDFHVEERGTEEIGGLKSAWIIYTHLQGQYRLRVKLYAVAGTDRAYLIHCFAETDAFDQFKDQFDETVKTFRVLP